MPLVLIVGDDLTVLQRFAAPLRGAGHEVEVTADAFRARERLSGAPCDVVVIDARSPDGGTGLLIEQARAAWPGCAVVALVDRPDLRRTKVHEMGLWTPDAVLVHPVPAEELLGTVQTLRPGARGGDDGRAGDCGAAL